MQCPRCNGRLLMGKPDQYGSNNSCLACGYQPLTPQEAAKREIARLDNTLKSKASHQGMSF